jgi:hypothetical protein
LGRNSGRPQQKTCRRSRHTGLDLEGYEHVISNDGFRHIHIRHGEGYETDPTQRGVTENDILLIPEITRNFDNAVPFKTKKGVRVKYIKRIDNEYYYVETIASKNNELIPKTMWIKK